MTGNHGEEKKKVSRILMVPIPRNVTYTTMISWGLYFLAGVFALMSPPMTITGTIGPILTIIWAIFFLTGGTLGVLGSATGWWWVERSGIIAAITGAVMYLYTIFWLHIDPFAAGSRLVQMVFILLAILALILRWMRVAGLQTDPSRGGNT